MSYLQSQKPATPAGAKTSYYILEPGIRPRLIERATRPAGKPSSANWPGVKGLAIAAGIASAAWGIVLIIAFAIGQVAA